MMFLWWHRLRGHDTEIDRGLCEKRCRTCQRVYQYDFPGSQW